MEHCPKSRPLRTYNDYAGRQIVTRPFSRKGAHSWGPRSGRANRKLAGIRTDYYWHDPPPKPVEGVEVNRRRSMEIRTIGIDLGKTVFHRQRTR
jgi:hypothetical protein